jgi:hypothetical protein
MFWKHIKKTLKKREFWFTILLYTAMAAGYFHAKNSDSLKRMTSIPHIWYFAFSLIFFVYIICYVAFEIIEKKLLHKVQGDKLRIKQEQNRK